MYRIKKIKKTLRLPKQWSRTISARKA